MRWHRILAFALALVVSAGCDREFTEPSPGRGDSNSPTIDGGHSSAVFDSSGLNFRRALHPGEAHRYDVQFGEGEWIHFRVDQLGSDVYLRLLDPEGRRLIQVDSRTADRDGEDLYFVTRSRGRHGLVVRAFDSNSGAGEYLAKLVERHPATNEDREFVAAEELFANGYERVEAGPLGEGTDEVIEDFERAAEIWDRLGHRGRWADAMYELAPIYRNRGRLLDALASYEAIRRHFPEAHRQAYFYNEMAQIWQETGDPIRARACYLEAMGLYQGLGDRWSQAVTLHNLARLDNREGRPMDALERLSRARELWETSGDRTQLAYTLNAIGEAYTKLGEVGLALDHHRRALALLDSPDVLADRANTFCFMANAYLEVWELDLAAEMFDQCLEFRERGGASQRRLAQARNGLGVVEARRGYPVRALEQYELSLATLEHQESLVDRATMLGNIGWLYSDLGQAEQALEFHREAMLLYDQLGHHEGQASSFLGLAHANYRLGDLEAALDFAESALEWIERVVETGQMPFSPEEKPVLYLSSRQHYFDFAIELSMELHRLAPTAGFDALALSISEQARARHLLEILARQSARFAGAKEPELARQRRLRDQINTLDRRFRLQLGIGTSANYRNSRQELRRVSDEYLRLTEDLGQTGPFQVPIHPPRPQILRTIRDLLDTETVLLHYHLGEERSFVWVVERDSLQSVELAPRSQIERLARRAHEMSQRSDQINYQIPAERDLRLLSEAIIAPLGDILRGQRLVIVADGALQSVPFSALPTESRRGLLVEDHEIVHLPSMSVLAMLRQRASSRPVGPGLLALVADPVYESSDPRLADDSGSNSPSPASVGRIRFTGREAAEILELTEFSGKTFSALGPEARKDRVVGGELADYRLLHFATHGLLREDSPELSALMLSRFDAMGRSIEGRLFLDEIYDLDFSAELVVLSACQSALGREIQGEGLMGLPRGFLYAGASRVVASLWRVQDESTAVLMTRFYRHLLVDGLSPAAALREAQRSMLADPRYAPYHWAGFVLQGDWQSLHFPLARH